MNNELMIQADDVWMQQEIVKQIKHIYGRNLTESEFHIFLQIGRATKLNPFLKEIWAVKYGNTAAQIFIGRDGYRKSAQSHLDYDYHQADAVYSNDKFEIVKGEISHNYSLSDRGNLLGAYCIVKRKSAEKSTYVFCDLKEYSTGKSLWTTKPATMIKKVAEAQALRMAFQGLFAGTYSDAEDWREERENNPAGKSQVRGIDGLKTHLGLTNSDKMSLALDKLNKANSINELQEVAEIAKDCTDEEKVSLRKLFKTKRYEIQNQPNCEAL
jgi:phage recombination protein Bet